MKRRTSATVLRYVVAVAAPCAVALLIRAVTPIMDGIPSATYLATILLLGWYGGLGPALVATALAVPLLDYFSFAPVGQLSVDLPSVVGLMLFFGVGAGIATVSARLRASLTAARESEARLQLAQRAARAGVFDRDLTADRLTWSPEYYELMGLDPSVEPSHAVWAACILEEDRDRVRRLVDESLEGSATTLAFDYRSRGAEGDVKWLSAYVRVLRNQAGKAVRLVGINIDITARKRAEAERDRLLAREQAGRRDAESENRAKDEFLAMLGHELRNPLGAISSAVGILDRRGGEDAAAVQARAVIRRQISHLSRIMDDLLDVGRVITGKIGLAPAPLGLAEAVERAVAAVAAAARGHERSVVVDVAPVWINGDRTRVEQIITNLLSNAHRYTPPGGTIRVTVRRDGGAAVLVVQDTGAGIAGDLLPRIFDLFVQGTQGLDRAAGGLGIGLTLVRHLTALHGGTITAASEGPGRGSTFTVRLPAIDAPAPAPDPPDGGRPPARRILIVEDNADAREMLRLALELDGHEVHAAADAAGGIEMAMKVEPDLALIDIGLPGVDGCEVARAIRARPLRRPVYLVALTGYGLEAAQRRSREAGFDAHVVKPLSAEALQQLVTAVDGAEARGER